MSHPNIPKPEVVGQKKGALSSLKNLSPKDGFEICLLVFSVLLLALAGSFIHFDVKSWVPLWKWTAIVGSVVLMLVVWLFKRKLMQKITDNLTSKVLEEGRLQGLYLERNGISRHHGQVKQGKRNVK